MLSQVVDADLSSFSEHGPGRLAYTRSKLARPATNIQILTKVYKHVFKSVKHRQDRVRRYMISGIQSVFDAAFGLERLHSENLKEPYLSVLKDI